MANKPSKYFNQPDEQYTVLIAIGSDSDQATLDESGMMKILRKVGISYHQSQVSAHRHDDDLKELCFEAINDHGTKIFIGGAGMAAALPGAIAAATKQSLPVLGVGLDAGFLGGLDALLSICRMPKGVPVAFMGLGTSGFVNAALHVCQIMSIGNEEIAARFLNYRAFGGKEPVFGVHTSYKDAAE